MPTPEPISATLSPVVGLRYHVTPNTTAEGKTLIINNPERGHIALPALGATVVWTVFWQKRLDEGDITVTKAHAS